MRNSLLGATLMEVVATITVAAIVGAIAIPVTSGFVDRARNNRAVGDIGAASLRLHQWQQQNGSLPGSLAEAGIEMPPDPWGRAYVYSRDGIRLAAANTDFDLYSLGRDGNTASELTAPVSQDDIVRARNGAYIGPAWNLAAAESAE